MVTATQHRLPMRDYLIRLASFSNVSFDFLTESVHPMNLSMSGFYYPGSGCEVICSACVKRADLNNFTTDPSDHIYHNPACSFVKPTPWCSSVDSDNFDTIPNTSLNYERGSSIETAISPDKISASNNADPTLHSTLKDSGQSSIERQRNDEISVREMTRSLLDRENQALKQIMKCKSCKISPVQYLFLPCGEMYTCKDCSNKFTHCPSCGKRILGTVNVFFS